MCVSWCPRLSFVSMNILLLNGRTTSLVQSPLMSVAFSKFHPSYVIGGTYSGQIVLWDTRSGKRTPIQRSPLSSSAHTHPVYCLDVVGSQNAHNLISVSTNGKLCSWNLDMLSQPQVKYSTGVCTHVWHTMHTRTHTHSVTSLIITPTQCNPSNYNP